MISGTMNTYVDSQNKNRVAGKRYYVTRHAGRVLGPGTFSGIQQKDILQLQFQRFPRPRMARGHV